MGGWDESRRAKFFCVVIQTTFRQLRNGRFLPNLATKRSSVSRRKHIFKNFHFRGHLPPKSEIANRSNMHLTQSRLQVTGCTTERYCLLHVVVRKPGSFQGQLFCTTYGCGVTGRQSCPIFRFYLFSPYKTPKSTSRWPAYSPGVTSQNYYDFSMR